jgi:hypothetical protein
MQRHLSVWVCQAWRGRCGVHAEVAAAFPTLAPVVDAFNKLNAAVTQWRIATDTLPSH